MNYNDQKLVYILKNQLAYANEEQLLEIINTKEAYSNFLYSILLLLEVEQLFIGSFPSIISNIFNIIKQRRFEYKISGELKKAENDIIVFLNKVNLADNDYIKQNYLFYQGIDRNCCIDSSQQLLYLIALDIRVIEMLENDLESKISKAEFISSTNYLMKRFPELYTKHPNHVNKTIEYIGNEIENKGESKYVRKNSKKINKILIKYNNQRK